MAFWKDLKEGLYKRKLKQSENKKVKRQAIKFSDAREIGILFDATHEKERKEILDYASSLKRSKRKVTLLGYYDAKEIPEDLGCDCFSNKDLGVTLTPNGKAEQVHAFMNQSFQVLMALHRHPSLPLEYIAAASNAKFRVGVYAQGADLPYELMVKDNSKSIRSLITQIEAYMDKL